MWFEQIYIEFLVIMHYIRKILHINSHVVTWCICCRTSYVINVSVSRGFTSATTTRDGIYLQLSSIRREFLAKSSDDAQYMQLSHSTRFIWWNCCSALLRADILGFPGSTSIVATRKQLYIIDKPVQGAPWVKSRHGTWYLKNTHVFAS